MKTTNKNVTVDLTKGSVNVINQLLKYKDVVNDVEPFFKKTAKIFKANGKKMKNAPVELIGAPIIYVKDGILWKLSIIQGNYSARLGGRKFESASYTPMAQVKDKFKSLTFDRFNLN